MCDMLAYQNADVMKAATWALLRTCASGSCRCQPCARVPISSSWSNVESEGIRRILAAGAVKLFLAMLTAPNDETVVNATVALGTFATERALGFVVVAVFDATLIDMHGGANRRVAGRGGSGPG
jgi:hypothetical protein